MIRRPPRSTLDRSSAASDVYKRQGLVVPDGLRGGTSAQAEVTLHLTEPAQGALTLTAVSYTHLRAHETVLDLVCRLLLEKKKNNISIEETNNVTTRARIQSHTHNALRHHTL